MAGGELGEVAAHGRRPVEHGSLVSDRFLELDTGGRQPFAVRRNAGAEAASFRKGRRRCTRRRETAGLVDAREFLWKALRPTAGDGGIVVDQDVRAVVDRYAVEYGLNQDEGLAVLITGRVRQFVVGRRELPVQKPEEGAPT